MDRVLRYHLGTAKQHTIYEAELVGLVLSLHLINTEKRSRKSCAIGLDNTVVLQSLQSELTNPGHHIAAEVLRIAKHLQRRNGNVNYSLKIRWTAGHMGIRGNEKADREAKRTAQGQSSARKSLPKYLRKTLPQSISTLRQANNKERNEKWKREWQTSKRYKRFKAKDTTSPASQKFLTLTSDHRISRKMASLIFQMRVRHAPLNSYLYQFQKVDSARCPACRDHNETVEHFLLYCPKYTHKQWPLLSKNRTILSITELLSDRKTVNH